MAGDLRRASNACWAEIESCPFAHPPNEFYRAILGAISITLIIN